MTRLLLTAALASLCMLAPRAFSQTLDTQRPLVRAAFENIESGQTNSPLQDSTLTNHPLYGWLEFAQLKRNLNTLDIKQANAFLEQYDGQAVASAFRDIWLPVLAKRGQWNTFLSTWQPTEDTALRCLNLQARSKQGHTDATWTHEAQTIWRNAGKSLPDSCDPVFAILIKKGQLNTVLRWERFEAAAANDQISLMRAIANAMPDTARRQALTYVNFLSNPGTQGLTWEKSKRNRQMATYGLKRLARNNPNTAEQLLPKYQKALGLSDTQRGEVLYQIAQWTVASYLPESERRLAEVPRSAYDERLHEWQVREALTRQDWPAALSAIRAMPEAQRNDSRWQWFEGRMLEKTGQPEAARKIYAKAAQASTFHGFLAADKLNQPYALCPREPVDNEKIIASIRKNPALVRAIELWKLDRFSWAVAEWNDAYKQLNDDQRRVAIKIARDSGWYDRAVFSLGKKPGELQFYSLRFPVAHGDSIRNHAQHHTIDPAWVAAEIRAESIFNPQARSPAKALGLMQVLPSTGVGVAKRNDIAYENASSLYNPDTNIAIGTAYLHELLDQYHAPYITIAAYNAGPGAAARWLSQRPNFDPDIWIETITYKETRDYVARVLAFSVIYDWRLGHDALPLADRMQGKTEGQRKPFACPSS